MKIRRVKTLRQLMRPRRSPVSVLNFALVAVLPLLALSFVALPHSALAQQQAHLPEEANFSKLVSALSNMTSELRSLRREGIEEVRLANVEQIREGLDMAQKETLDDAVERTVENSDTNALYSAISDNELIMGALEEEAQGRASVQDVVAVDVGWDGVAVVYYEPTE